MAFVHFANVAVVKAQEVNAAGEVGLFDSSHHKHPFAGGIRTHTIFA